MRRSVGSVVAVVVLAAGTARCGSGGGGAADSPVVTAVMPQAGSTAGGDAVTIEGSAFAAPVTVTIGGVPAVSVVVVDAQTLVVETPPGSVGAADVVVTAAGGADTLVDGFRYVVCPLALDGGALPGDQGWTTHTNVTSATTTTDGFELTVDTFGATTGDLTGPRLLYARDVGLAPGLSATVEWQMQVLAADPHNPFDAGVAFLPSLSLSPFGTPEERDQMIYFDEDEIGWADETQSFAMDTTDGPHLYQLHVDAFGTADLYVDGVLALTRDGVFLGPIAFGDHTNDPSVDGSFILGFVTVLCP